MKRIVRVRIFLDRYASFLYTSTGPGNTSITFFEIIRFPIVRLTTISFSLFQLFCQQPPIDSLQPFNYKGLKGWQRSCFYLLKADWGLSNLDGQLFSVGFLCNQQNASLS